MVENQKNAAEKIAVIGGGAAGFFAALNCKNNFPQHEVQLFEKSNKTLSKVKISGGGRCNVTHHCFNVKELMDFYPRGGKKLKKAFQQFNPQHTIEWFKERGVELKTEADNRMFPTTDKSFTIVNCFVDEAEKLAVKINLGFSVDDIQTKNGKFSIWNNEQEFVFDRVIIATGGGTKLSSYDWLKAFNLTIVPPAPSLFTFNIPIEKTAELMGLVAENTVVKVQGTKLQQSGPVLFTHWGMSGPAILKLSAWGAEVLRDKNYHFNLTVNWTGLANEEIIRTALNKFKTEKHKRKLGNSKVFDGISNRLWDYIIQRSECDSDIIWAELPKKNFNKLVNCLFNDLYQVQGKTTFKEEFVTCGGISLEEVNLSTFESKQHPGLYFAGEILNIDGVTGGFNFQAAWSTAFAAAKLSS